MARGLEGQHSLKMLDLGWPEGLRLLNVMLESRSPKAPKKMP